MKTLKVYVIHCHVYCVGLFSLPRHAKRLHILHWFTFQFHVQTLLLYAWIRDENDESQQIILSSTSTSAFSNDWLKINYKTYFGMNDGRLLSNINIKKKKHRQNFLFILFGWVILCVLCLHWYCVKITILKPKYWNKI